MGNNGKLGSSCSKLSNSWEFGSLMGSPVIMLFQRNLLVFISVLLILQTTSLTGQASGARSRSSKTPSGLYHDDGKGHTILTQRFSKKDVREISYDILNIMGFHHRPHPHLVDKRSPASQFLLEVYNSIGNEADVDLSNGEHGKKQNWRKNAPKNLSWSEFNVDSAEVDAIKKADAIISFDNRGHPFSNKLKQFSEDKQFWFDVSEVSQLDQVLGAELRIWKRTLVEKDDDLPNSVNTNPASEVFRIAVHEVSPGADDSSFELKELDEIMTAKWEQGWLRFNVTSAFKRWIHYPKDNLGLVISTKSADSGIETPMSKSGLATIMDAEEHQPFLVSFLKTSEENKAEKAQHRSSRIIRSANGGGGDENTSSGGGGNSGANGGGGGGGGGNRRRNKKTKKGRNYEFSEVLDRPKSCQMGMLYVNFEDLGWKDWVIAPDGFIAYYCHGECSFPLTASMNATNHAIVSTLVHTYYPLEYPKPSCSPVKLGSISMLYYDDNSNVTVKKYKDMVIKSCGCK